MTFWATSRRIICRPLILNFHLFSSHSSRFFSTTAINCCRISGAEFFFCKDGHSFDIAAFSSSDSYCRASVQRSLTGTVLTSCVEEVADPEL